MLFIIHIAKKTAAFLIVSLPPLNRILFDKLDGCVLAG